MENSTHHRVKRASNWQKKKYVSEIRHIIIEMYPVIINNVCTAVLLPETESN